MPVWGWVLIVIAVVAVIIIGYIVSKRNKFVSLSENIDNSFAQVDVQLKRRYDLIPNLVNTVKGYAAHEKDTLDKVVSLRNAAAGAKTVDEKIALNNQLGEALSKLMLVVEAYPDLKANTNFLSLQDTLRDTENKIAISRQVYNDCVTKFNKMVKMFPANIVAGMFGFTERQYLETSESERENVKVEF